jgi:hypothetical protein
MKKIILSALAVFAFGFANAQDDEGGFKAGIHLGLPMGDAGDVYNLNFGVDVAYMWPVADSFKAGITTGYSYYAGEEIDYGFGTEKFNGAFIPVAATGQYSLSEDFFLGVDLGYGIYVGDGDGDGGFYYQPKVGYQMDKIEVYVAYKGIAVEGTTISSVGVGAAYKF